MRFITQTLAALAALTAPLTAGDGSQPIMAPPVTVVPEAAVAIVSADLDGDGHLDLLTSGGLGKPSLASLGDGQGGFTVVDLIPGAIWQVDPQLADLTGDGVPDLLVALGGGETVQTRVGLGDGSFGPATELFSINGSTQLGTADVDADGDLDVLIAAWSPVDAGHDAIHHLINDGSGVFTADLLVGLENPLADLWVGDLDGDGVHDLVLYESFPSSRLIVRLGQGGASYGRETLVYSWSVPAPWELQVADVTGDGDVDLLMIDPSHDRVQVFENPGAGGFGQTIPQNVALPDEVSSVVAVDLEGDGPLELVVSSRNTLQMWVLSGSGLDTWTPVIDVAGALDVLAAADMDADGRVDLLLQRSSSPSGVQLARNLSYPAGGPFTNLGLGGLAGTQAGTPVLVAGGQPVAGETLTLTSLKTPAGTPTWFVVGLSTLELPFKGGLMVPTLSLLLGPIPSDAAGQAQVATVWPAGLPGFQLWLQVWCQDGTGPAGFTASPAARLDVP